MIGNLKGMYQTLVASLCPAQSEVKTVFLTICHFVYHNNNTTDTATMPCSAALIREEPCQLSGTSTAGYSQAFGRYVQGFVVFSLTS